MSPIAFRARWVFPVSGSPIPGGVVTIVDDRIVSVGTKSEAPTTDLGDVAILPGLVNAHTHLEFSDCERPLGRPGMPLPDWIREVIRYRRAETGRVEGAAQIGLLETIRRGTAAIGEIATAGWDPRVFERPSPRALVFYELIGLGEERIDANIALAVEHLRLRGRVPFELGLSPHAPYTVNPRLFKEAVALAAFVVAPVAMHLAESPEEIELLRDGAGPFVGLLEELGAWRPEAIPRGSRPLDYLQCLAQAPRSLVIHGNFLDDEEINFLAERRDRMCVVYCPRTHAYFGHTRHPLASMLARGVHVALGTDSRASNPNLDLMAEMRHVAATFPEISPHDMLRLGTIEGARAMDLEHNCGSLLPGKWADLVEVRVSDRRVNDPHELLFEGSESAALWTRTR